MAVPTARASTRFHSESQDDSDRPASFSKCRKSLLKALASSEYFGSKGEVEGKLEQAGIDSGRRGETLSVEEFVELADILKPSC